MSLRTMGDDSVAQPPQVEAQRRTPDVVAREVRKFALDQAVKSLEHVAPRDAPDGIVGIAARFENYILNGKQDK